MSQNQKERFRLVDYLYSFIIGGITVALVTVFVKNGRPAVAGILMTLPVITMLSLIVVPNEVSAKVAVGGILGAIGLVSFLVAFLTLTFVFKFAKFYSFASACSVWLFVVIVLIRIFPDYFNQ